MNRIPFLFGTDKKNTLDICQVENPTQKTIIGLNAMGANFIIGVFDFQCDIYNSMRYI